jgi:ubiquinone/menaquinone biosynthesis C-methylase UbiE
LRETTLEYYERRAREYDATSWAHLEADATDSVRVRNVLSSLPAVSTLDIGCGTGFVSRWLPGRLTLMDSSPAMLSIARGRLPDADLVRAEAPYLPFAQHAFGRAFTANLYGHLPPPARSELVREVARIAAESIVLEQVSVTGSFEEGPEERILTDGTKFTIYKCYFTEDRLLAELGGGEILLAGRVFAIIRRP